MKKNTNNKIKKYCIGILLVIVMAGLTCFFVYAAYTNLNSVKRVVSTQGGNDVAFSSNYLNLVTQDVDQYDLKRISIPENSASKEFVINICNYVLNNPSVINDGDITYTFRLTLIDPIDGTTVTDKDSEATVNDGSVISPFSNGIFEIDNQTLLGKTKSTRSYTVSVPKAFIDTVNIKAEAVPDAGSYGNTKNYKLGKILAFSEYSESATSWTGEFSETETEGYDGFNYILKGQGVGTVTLTWDPDKLEISKVFLDNNGLSVTEADGRQKLTMPVDSDTGAGRYDIQFYKTKNGVYDNMTTVKSYITFRFEEG